MRRCCQAAPRGSAATSHLDSTAFLGKSCKVAAGSVAAGCGAALATSRASWLPPSLPPARSPAPLPQHGARKGSAHCRHGRCKPLPMAGRARRLVCSTAAFPWRALSPAMGREMGQILHLVIHVLTGCVLKLSCNGLPCPVMLQDKERYPRSMLLLSFLYVDKP